MQSGLGPSVPDLAKAWNLQAIGKGVTDYAKRSFEDATRAWEQLVGAKSVEHAFEIQNNYAKKA